MSKIFRNSVSRYCYSFPMFCFSLCWLCIRACNFIKKKLQHKCFPVKFTKVLRAPILKNICEGLLLYFQYNYHHHFYYHCLHYHRKTRLYCLKIPLTIFLDCNLISCLFQLNFVLYFSGMYFSLVLFQDLFFTPSKRT